MSPLLSMDFDTVREKAQTTQRSQALPSVASGLTMCAGAQGGSDTVNTEMKRITRKKLRAMAKDGRIHLEPGDLAAYIQSWEEQKFDLNFDEGTDEDLTVFLWGKRRTRTIQLDIRPDEIREAFQKALKKTLATLRNNHQLVLGMGRDFAILYCGGTPENPGVRSILRRDTAELQKQANKLDSPVRIAYNFLGRPLTAESSAQHYWCVQFVKYFARIAYEDSTGHRLCQLELDWRTCTCAHLPSFCPRRL